METFLTSIFRVGTEAACILSCFSSSKTKIISKMLLVYWVCAFVAAVNSDLTMYREVGDKVVLPTNVTGHIKSIRWDYDSQVVAYWIVDQPEVTLYGHIQERGSVNLSMGALTLTGLTLEDSGLYTATTNTMTGDHIIDNVHLIVLSLVSTPTLSKSCDNEITSCVLTCNGSTKDTEPITYIWRFNDSVLPFSAEQEHISKEEYSSAGEFSCELKNPVSQARSQGLPNPFILELTVYVKVGDNITLEPHSSVTDKIQRITWNHGLDLAVLWNEGEPEVDSYRQFKERSSLDTSVGALTMTGLTPEDSGLYTVEINGFISTTIHLIVISPVPTPTLSKSCDNETASCVLTCNGTMKDADPITYIWRFNDVVLPFSAEQENISQEEYSSAGEFSCELKNPVSQARSQGLPNPFISEAHIASSGSTNASVGFWCLSCLLGAMLLVGNFHKWKTGMWFFQKDAMPWEAVFWSHSERQTTPVRDAEHSGSAAVPPAEGAKLMSVSQPEV